MPKNKTHAEALRPRPDIGGDGGITRFARDSLALRLASELADKRYAVGLEFAKQSQAGAF